MRLLYRPDSGDGGLHESPSPHLVGDGGAIDFGTIISNAWQLKVVDRATSDAAATAASDGWAEALEAGAATFEQASADDASAVNVTCQLDGSQGEVLRLVLLVCRLVERFCLDARVRVHEGSLTVRFCRMEGPDPSIYAKF